MSKKWNKVIEALGCLYEQYHGGGGTDDAVEYLMEAYDEWLNGERDESE